MPHFHFSIGPVQELVSQARSTNDFWAGSFLLSWLVGVAMCAVQKQGGEIVFPTPPDGFLDWISGKQPPPNEHPMARVGAIPNRFAASVPTGFDGAQIEAAVREAWQALATHTLQQDGLDLNKLDAQLASPPGQGSRLLWQRQIKDGSRALWEIQWISADSDAAASAGMNARKLWRNFSRTPEPGRKCALMAGWQEMSGLNAYNQVERFWDAARAMVQARGGVLNVDPREHLCAPAYVKRRFALHFESFRHDGIVPLRGWPLRVRVPSTIDLAEQSTPADGTPGRPGQYYALLLMDGDNLGQHLQRNQTLVATALKTFTAGVNQRIQQYKGFLVYAGGDDVFALLPMQHALPCALALRGDYQTAFIDASAQMQVNLAGSHLPTLSAAIEFAHCKTPLTQLINDSHALLDEVAKAGHGRDSLAVRVWKPSGQHLSWGMPWEKALQQPATPAQPPGLIIEDIASRLQHNPLLFSAGFFFRAQALFASTQGIANDNEVKELLLYEYAHSLASERRKQAFDASTNPPDKASNTDLKTRLDALLTPLLEQSRHTRRRIHFDHSPRADSGTAASPTPPDQQIDYEYGAAGPDCAFLIRFLVQRGWANAEGERA